MTYDAGSISATLTARFEELAFKRFDRAHADAERKAQKKIEAALGAKIDDRAFAVYTQKLNEAQARASRRDAFKASLGADYDGRAFQAMERDLAKTSVRARDTERNTNFLSRAFGNLASSAGAAGGAVGGRGGGLGASLGGLHGPLGITLGLLAAMTPMLVAVTGAATALAGSLAAAAAGAAAVSVGFAAAMGPIGGLMAALTSRIGVLGEAYKALDKQQTKGAAQATSVAETQRAAAQRIKGAQDALADSNRAVMRAQEDLTEARFKARREVQDLTDAVTHSAFAEERASLTLREVLQRLAEAEADPTATRLQLDQARFAVKEAKHAVKDTAREHARANTDARRGTDTVRDATEQLATARRQAARASDQVAAANAAAAVATGKQGAAATDAQQKMAQLSATERRLVRTFQNFSKAFRRTFAPATDAIFTGVNGALERLQPVMERFRGRFARLGDTIGSIIDGAAESLAGPAWTAALDSFIATAQRIVKPLSNAFGSVINIFRNIAVAAQPYVIEFADYLERALSRLEGKTRGEGLNRTIKSLVDSTKDWWHFMLAVGDLLITVFGGGKKEGDSLVESMTRMVKRWDDFLETDEGQTRMKDFFRDAVGLARDLGKVVLGAGKAVVRFTGFVASHKDEIIALAAAFITYKTATTGAAIAQALLNGALLANPIGLVVAAIAALAGGLVYAYRKSETFREIVHDAFQSTRRIVGSAVDGILGLFTTMLGGLSSIASGLSFIPGIGDKFKGAARGIDTARDAIDKLREGVREATNPMEAFSNAAEEMSRKTYTSIKSLRKDIEAQMRRVASATQDGSDESRAALSKNFRAGAAAVRAAMKAGTISTREGLAEIRRLMRENLKLYGFTESQARNIAATGDPDANRGREGGAPIRRAVGGWIGERGMVGEDTVPIIAAPGEAVLNRHQVPMVDEALAQAGYGGLDDLFARVQRPHYMARGGMVPRHMARGGIVPIPWQPGEEIAASALPLATQAHRMFGVGVSDAFDRDRSAGHKSPGHNVTGTAVDFVGTPAQTDAVARWAVQQGFTTYYDGRFGTTNLPPHGPGHHIHVEFGSKTGKAGGGAVAAAIRRVLVGGPGGALGRVTQGAVDTQRGAANKLLRRMAGAGGGSGGVPVHGDAKGSGMNLMRAIAKARGWNFADWWELDRRETSHGRNLSNPTSSARLRGQFLDMNWGKYGPGSDPRRNPSMMQQIHSMARYIAERYGNPTRARAHHDANNWYHQGGRIKRFAPGGMVGGGKARKSSGGGYISSKPYRGLKKLQGQRVTRYDRASDELDRLQAEYSYQDREFNLDDEALIDPETGAVNVEAVNSRGRELTKLLEIREKIVAKLAQMRRLIELIQTTYRNIISRLKKARDAISRKNKSGRQRYATYTDSLERHTRELAEWGDKDIEVFDNWREARLDVDETRLERAAVLGTQADPRSADTPEPAVQDTAPQPDSGFDTGPREPAERPLLTPEQDRAHGALERDAALARLTPDQADDEGARAAQETFWRGVLENLQATGGSDSLVTQAANTLAGLLKDVTQTAVSAAEQLARQVSEQLRSLDAGRADLFKSFGSNFVSPAAAANQLIAIGGTRYFGAGGGAAGYEQTGSVIGATGGERPSVEQHVHLTLADPGDTHTFTRSALHEMQAAV